MTDTYMDYMYMYLYITCITCTYTCNTCTCILHVFITLTEMIIEYGLCMTTTCTGSPKRVEEFVEELKKCSYTTEPL